MRNEILAHFEEPAELEKMYRGNKAQFKKAFNDLHPELKGNTLAAAWNARLNFEADEITWGTGRDLWFVVLASMTAGFIAKIPAIFGVSEDFFYPRNIGFIFLPLLAAYFAWKNKLQPQKTAMIGGAMLLLLIYINLLPTSANSDTLVLACIHLVVVLWVLLGSAFAGKDLSDNNRRLDFLRYNGDLVVMTTLILIAGAIMTGLTIGLFSVIGFNIEKFYFENIAVAGLAAAPIVGTYLIRTNPQLVGKVSPVIAKIFSPLVLVMLVIYLVAMLFSGKDPYNNREFLMIFNALLVGVMAIIFFSLSDSGKTTKTSFEIYVLLLLSVVTVVVNGIALSAILYRISEWGITPNRIAVLGGNILILGNLLMVSTQLLKVISKKADTSNVGRAIAVYLPVYAAWATVVVFLFPLLFGFK